MNQRTCMVWFRRDLRLLDNQALCEAVKEGDILPVFIWSPEEEEKGSLGEPSSWWLYHSLKELESRISEMGGKLIIRKGPALAVLKDLFEETGVHALYFNERYEPMVRTRDLAVKEVLEEDGIQVESFHSNLLFPPYTILNKQHQPYKIFTPFWKACLQNKILFPACVPTEISFFQGSYTSLNVSELELLPEFPWYEKWRDYWEPGEIGAMRSWERFVERGLLGYGVKRDYPFADNISRLSAHLTWGELSPRWIWHYLFEEEMLPHSIGQDDVYAFLRQIVWREFAYNQMVCFPEMIDSPLRPEFLAFPWEAGDSEEFTAWKKGKTGYPLVDAGMCELWETGWMHNRVRMVTASFLVKHLLIPWQQGAAWFEETLVDADLANNSMGWQWVSGTGFDSAPYFRIFNPITQGEKFDPKGEYIRRWVPELAGLPDSYIHKPWAAPKKVLREAGVELGCSYPFPVVEHSFARERALEAYERIKNRKNEVEIVGK